MEIMEDSSLDIKSASGTHFRGLRHLVFAIFDQHTFVTYDLYRRLARAVIPPSAARDNSFWKTKLLPVTIGILGTTLGVAPLHCACVTRDGHGLLIAGASGAGKSTLTAALARCGYSVVSDDWTYVSRDQAGLIAEGLSAPIKLLPDAARFFPELHKFTPHKTLNGEIAYEVDPATFRRGSTSATSRPKCIIFLERNASNGQRFLPLNQKRVQEFFETSAERLPDELASAKRTRSEIIRHLSACPAWLLRTGDSPQETAEAIEIFQLKVANGNH